MPEEDASIAAEGGKRVTITIAEKGSSTSDPTPSASNPNQFVIDNGFQILTITIAE
jgi:hypothetical protein